MRKWFKIHKIKRMLLIAAMISITVLFPVCAADGTAFIQNSRTEEDKVFVYCSSLGDAGQTYNAEQFHVAISGQEIPVLGVSTAEMTGEGVTFYCLIDVSGSMYETQIIQAKQTLSAICQGLSENDNMVIGELGEKLEKVTGFLTDKAEIQSVIDGLYAYSDYTDLYGIMTDSLIELQSNNSSRKKKCLVVISDGDDVSMAGKTRNELLAAIEKSAIPVYTVAALRGTDEAYIESAKNLGEFARQSVGGKHYAPLVDQISAEEAGQRILEDNHKGIILTLDTSKVQADKDELLLSIQLQTGTATYNDTRYLYASDLKFSKKEEITTLDETEEQTSAAEETKIEEPEEPKPQPIEKDNKKIWLISAAIIVVVLIVIIMLVLYGRKKKRKKAALIHQEQAGEKDSEPETEEENRQGITEELGTPAILKEADKGFAYQVKFAAIGYENIVFILSIPEEKMLTIGRDDKADLVLNPSDRNLSSVHCRVRCMKDKMNVWDMDSQTGTFVNGVSVRQIGMATVKDKDIIRMGSYEYRVFISKGV